MIENGGFGPVMIRPCVDIPEPRATVQGWQDVINDHILILRECHRLAR